MRRAIFALLTIATAVACGLDLTGAAEVAPPLEAGAPGVDASRPPPDSAAARDAGPFTLTMRVTEGAGKITTDVGTIACPPDCTVTVGAGRVVTLKADHDLDSTLRGWGEGCIGRDPSCAVKVTGATSVYASFAPLVHYMNTPTHLYRVGTDGKPGAAIAWKGDCADDTIADIAIDRNGAAYAISTPGNSQLFSLDLASGTCRYIGFLGDPGSLTCDALAVAPDPDDPTKDALYATGGTTLYRVSVITGKAAPVGTFGEGYASNGDLVWGPGFGMLVSMPNVTGYAGDRLGTVDLRTGKISKVVDLRVLGILGLGWRGPDILAYLNGYGVIIEGDLAILDGGAWNDATGVVGVVGAASGPVPPR